MHADLVQRSTLFPYQFLSQRQSRYVGEHWVLEMSKNLSLLSNGCQIYMKSYDHSNSKQINQVQVERDYGEVKSATTRELGQGFSSPSERI